MNSFTEETDSFQVCEFREHLSLLRRIYFFSKMPIETLKVFAYLCTREKFKPGDVLFRQGEDDGHAFYIISGTARLVHEDGKDVLHVGTFGEEQFVGGLSLLGNMQRLYSFMAETDMVCLVMTRDKVGRALARFPELMPLVMQTVVDRVGRWEENFLRHHSGSPEKCFRNTGVTLI